MSENWQDHVLAEPPPRPLRSLPVFVTVGQAVGMLFANLGGFLRAAFLPATLSLFIGLLFWYLIPESIQQLAHQTRQSGHTLSAADWRMAGLAYAVSLSGLVPYTLFAVSWHRLLLLGPTSGKPAILPAWRRRHWLFLGYTVLLCVLSLLALAPLALIVIGANKFSAVAQGQIQDQGTPWLAIGLLTAGIIGYIVGLASFMRFPLVLPARAVDERFGLRHAWRLGRGQGWRLLITFMLTMLVMTLLVSIAAIPLALALYVPAALIWGLTEQANTFVGTLINVFLAYPATALFIAVLSIAFRTVSGWVPSAQDPGPPAPT